MNNVLGQMLTKPEIYTGLMIDMVQKLGFAAAMATIFALFGCGMVIYLLKHVVEGYKTSLCYLNDQNKKYQDHFLLNRTSSDRKFLGELTDKKE